MITAIVIGLVWFASGAWSFIYWWTKDHDLTTEEIMLIILCGILGPFSFGLGYCVHGEEKVLIRKRTK